MGLADEGAKHGGWILCRRQDDHRVTRHAANRGDYYWNIINFGSLKDKDVLEIGVGNGSHAQLLAQHAGSFTGIDLTEYAVKSTTERMRCFGLNARVLRMDAENMEFADSSFDFIWTWGVIHHSSNTRRVLQEMHRVLRPGGTAITMLYHRSFWYYYILGGLINGVLRGQLLRTRSLHKITQQMIDGALARYYTIPEWKDMTSEFFDIEKILIYGSKAEIVPLPGGAIKTAVMACIPNPLSRLLTNRLKMGYFLVSILKKPG
ncbi:MAG: class I SAM-dependent methyltransferase [Acidobacteriota bacterium]